MARTVTTVSSFFSGVNTKEEMVEEQSLMKTSVDGVALDWGGAIARGPRGLGGAAAQEDHAGQRIVADGGKRRSGERREAKFNSLRNGGGEGDL